MNQSPREAILARVRGAIAQAPAAPSIPRAYRERDERDRVAILSDFVDRLLDYKAQVTRADEAGLPNAIAEACQRHAITRLAMPNDLPSDWQPAGITIARDEPPLDNSALDACSAVLTGCAVAVAQTGTIILDGGMRQGRRALTLVPDIHLCVVYEEQVVGLVPEAIAALAERSTRPITFISGPSATSDIELNRVEGVHGPRTLHVILVTKSAHT
ncbi:LutC/YkgG family protein [Ktedonospora formicarum]|uniref:Lactate utilization protein C n=1 Tax=Ktedonospora formicarum TaxID=2778364 RepID=A0A8J3I2S9_9CHLR|nr:lactate utilization protein C [Ktedonospora formicarum]GHO48269.1 lactate utilization protein C [Ktedonospora formicarum]